VSAVLSKLTDTDRTDLRAAAALVQDVAGRHPLEMTGPILIALQAAVHDIEVLSRYLEAIT